MFVINVPKRFQPDPPIVYPIHQKGPRIEKAIHQALDGQFIKTSMVYLPIYWDNYIVSAKFGRDKAMMDDLQKYVEMVTMTTTGKLWTICEYADGLCIDVDPTKLHVFYCACEGGTTLPLLCDPHPTGGDIDHYWLASFCGSLDTHPIRKIMKEECSNSKEIKIADGGGTEVFRNLMRSSMFALCPAGYGPTSYRLFEAMQMGIPPVYYSDREYLLPYKDELPWVDMCLFMRPGSNVYGIDRALEYYMNSGWQGQAKDTIRDVYNDYFTMDGVSRWIWRWLENVG